MGEKPTLVPWVAEKMDDPVWWIGPTETDAQRPAWIAQTVGGNNEANAAFIVRACNSHDILVAACQEMLRTLTSPSRRLLDSTRREMEPWLPMLRNAIAAATE